MKEKLRITSLLKGDTDLVCKTWINGEPRILTERFVELSASEFETNPLYKNDRILTILFTHQNKVWELEYDTDDKRMPADKLSQKLEDEDYYITEQIKQDNELNRRKRTAAREFFPRHQQLQHLTEFDVKPVNPSGQPIATLEMVSQKSRGLHLSDRKKAHVFSIIDSMTWPQQYDVGLYYAPDQCFGKRRSDVLHALIGLKEIGTANSYLGGKLWQKNPNGKGILADDFINNYQKNSNAVMKIYVEKGIGLGLISRGTGGLYLKAGNVFLGKTANDAVAHFTKNMQEYTNALQPEVDRLGELPEDDMTDHPAPDYAFRSKWEKEQSSAISTREYANHYEKLLTEAEELSGVRVPDEHRKYKDLQKYVEQLREKKDKQLAKEMSPTGQLDQAVDDLSTDDMEVLKKIAQKEGVKGWHTAQIPENLKEKIREKRNAPVVNS